MTKNTDNDFFKTIFSKLPGSVGIITYVIAFIYLQIITLWLFNYFGANYDSIVFLPSEFILILPLTFLLFCIGLYIEDDFAREASILKNVWLFNITIVTINLFVTVIQTTPFHPINDWVQAMDEALGFNVNNLLNWTYQQVQFYYLLQSLYGFLYFQLALIPVFLIIGLQHRAVRVYFLSCLLASIIGFTFYYFFPTNGPATILDNDFFLPNMYFTHERFQAMQSHLPVIESTASGGMIALPSFHVIWAAALIYATKNFKPLFFLIFIINSLIIFSTVALGWHFLMDVIFGLIIIAFTTYLAEWVYKYQYPEEKVFPQYQLW